MTPDTPLLKIHKPPEDPPLGILEVELYLEGVLRSLPGVTDIETYQGITGGSDARFLWQWNPKGLAALVHLYRNDKPTLSVIVSIPADPADWHLEALKTNVLPMLVELRQFMETGNRPRKGPKILVPGMNPPPTGPPFGGRTH